MNDINTDNKNTTTSTNNIDNNNIQDDELNMFIINDHWFYPEDFIKFATKEDGSKFEIIVE